MAYGQTCLDERAVAVVSVVAVVSGVAITHGDKGTKILAQLVVGIDACLYGIESFRLVGLVLEGLYMVEAHIATQCQSWCEVEILSDAIIDGTGEIAVETHIVGSRTKNVIGAAVAVAHGSIELGARSGRKHIVDGGLGIDVDQSYLVCQGVASDVDNAHLPSPWMCQCHIDESYLRTVERVGIVGSSQLNAAHISRRHVEGTSQLYAFLHSHSDIADGAELYASERSRRHIGNGGELHTVGITVGNVCHQSKLHIAHGILVTDNTYRIVLGACPACCT